MEDKVKNNGDNYRKIPKKDVISMAIMKHWHWTVVHIWTTKEWENDCEFIPLNKIQESKNFYIIYNSND